MTAHELVGVWRPESFHDIDSAGTSHEGPLGSEPRGLLSYSADGHVCVTMMRTGPARPERGNYMSYAGTWRREGDRVVHTIDVAPESGWLGTEQSRDLELDRDELVLHGTALVGRPQRRVPRWRRITGDAV
ncbi:lipocalin-like domain-containing protein [Streptantibioticus ferralitis]|uniref:Lipocalin-like domain-containing protein n=1 Tax=Streptantibioticus ferralitis TaxID=236510 RepID=A0ABT5YV73_9ACTN|nr:lipocalin-like domain-containing protein [Streptantibioticus ferralitis]MDF2255486.1 lipocalin-like domain-containing protein [Streptantibioticus ferralitis]